MITLPGVDVSSFQGEPGQWRGLAGHIAFAGVKFTELSASGPYTNPTALADWAALHAMGAGRVAYLFGHPSAGVTATVDLFLSVLHPVLADTDSVALDLEVPDGLPPARVATWGREVLTLLEHRTSRRALLYTFRSFAIEGNCAGMGSHLLWIADPDHPAGKPDVPAPWKTWAVHQYASSPIDRDVAAYPSLGAMRAALGKPAPTPQPAPATEDDMPALMKPGAGSVTPVSIPAGKSKLVLTPEDMATVGVQTHDHGTTQVELAWQPPGGKVVPVPGGVQFVHLHRIDAGTGDVSYAVE
jgi:lysozyme